MKKTRRRLRSDQNGQHTPSTGMTISHAMVVDAHGVVMVPPLARPSRRRRSANQPARCRSSRDRLRRVVDGLRDGRVAAVLELMWRQRRRDTRWRTSTPSTIHRSPDSQCPAPQQEQEGAELAVLAYGHCIECTTGPRKDRLRRLGHGLRRRRGVSPPSGDPTCATCIRPDPAIARSPASSRALRSAICSRYRATSSGARLAG